MITRQDFILNNNGDFPLQDTVINGVWIDTPYGNSDQQHIRDIIVDFPGWIKQYPEIGFGVLQYINAEFNLTTVVKNLKIQMGLDGYTVTNGAVTPVSGGGFGIRTSYIIRQ